MQDAFEAALEQWPREGSRDNPRAWLSRSARNKAIDRIRRERAARRAAPERRPRRRWRAEPRELDADDEGPATTGCA